MALALGLFTLYVLSDNSPKSCPVGVRRDVIARTPDPRQRCRLRCLLTLAAALAVGSGQSALAAATAWVGDDHASARLITAVEAVGSGSTVDAGLEIRLAPGWHAYWRSPGDAGIAPSIDWAGSSNLAHAEIAWPAPTRLSQQGFETAVYDDRVVLPITLPRRGRDSRWRCTPRSITPPAPRSAFPIRRPSIWHCRPASPRPGRRRR